MKVLLPLPLLPGAASLMLALLFASCAPSSSTNTLVRPGQDMLAAGVYAPGHNITEPRPRHSEYLRTAGGGVAVLKNAHGLYLDAEVIKRPAKDFYLTVDFENPDGTPMSLETVLKPDSRGFRFSVPRTQSGLRSYADYLVIVRVWNAKGDKAPLDTLVQKVRSYVDTRGAEPQVFSSLTQQQH